MADSNQTMAFASGSGIVLADDSHCPAELGVASGNHGPGGQRAGDPAVVVHAGPVHPPA